MNIGSLTEYATLYRRVEKQSDSGAIEKFYDSELGHIFVRVNSRPGAPKEIADGQSDTTTIEVLARYFDTYQTGLKPEDFIEIDSIFYKIKGFSDAPEYGIKTAVRIIAEMMNQSTLSI